MAKVVKLTITLDAEIEKLLRNLAKEETRPISSEVAHIIKWYSANRNK